MTSWLLGFWLLGFCPQDDDLKKSWYPAAPGWEWVYEGSGKRREGDVAGVELVRRCAERSRKIAVAGKEWDAVEVVKLERQGGKETEIGREYVAVDGKWTRIFGRERYTENNEEKDYYSLLWGIAHDFDKSGLLLDNFLNGDKREERERKVTFDKEVGNSWYSPERVRCPAGEFTAVKNLIAPVGGWASTWYARGSGPVRYKHSSGAGNLWEFKLKKVTRK